MRTFEYVFYKGKNGPWNVFENIATLRNNNLKNSRWEGHLRGFIAEYAVAKHFNIMPDLNIYQKDGNGPSGDPGVDLRINNQRIQVKSVGPDRLELKIGTLVDIESAHWDFLVVVRMHPTYHNKSKDHNGYVAEIIGCLDKNIVMQRCTVCNEKKECAIRLSCFESIEKIKI